MPGVNLFISSSISYLSFLYVYAIPFFNLAGLDVFHFFFLLDKVNKQRSAHLGHGGRFIT
jgi:hypothetical protein